MDWQRQMCISRWTQGVRSAIQKWSEKASSEQSNFASAIEGPTASLPREFDRATDTFRKLHAEWQELERLAVSMMIDDFDFGSDDDVVDEPSLKRRRRA